MDITSVLLNHQADTAKASMEVGIKERNEILYQCLEEFFENKGILEQSVQIGSMHAEYEVIVSNKDDPFVKHTITELLKEFRDARHTDKSNVTEILADSYQAIRHATSNAANMAILQKDLTKVSRLTRVKGMIREAGDIVEGSPLPLIRFRTALLQISRGNYNSFSDVVNMSFGDCIKYLEERSLIENVHYLGIGLPINQLRNVSQHNSYEVVDDSIVLIYGRCLNINCLLLMKNF